VLLQAFNAVCRIAAPATIFKSEAIVHPDEIIEYISPAECQLSYNPLQMALIWNTLATREVNLLAQALAERHALPAGTAWVNYVRSHDDIGWTFADEDAARVGINGYDHRRFLNAFYAGRFEGSFARGLPFQENPRTGDSRVAGTTASLAGLESGDPLGVARILAAHAVMLSTGGIPVIYLGDEVGQLNDYSYRGDPATAVDSRWAGRPWYPAEAYASRADASTDAGRVYTGLRRLIEVRASTPEFAGNELVPFDTKNPNVLGYLRPGPLGDVLCLTNFADTAHTLPAEVLSGMVGVGTELISGRAIFRTEALALEPLDVLWIQWGPTPASS
jgi:amylosucrase